MKHGAVVLAFSRRSGNCDTTFTVEATLEHLKLMKYRPHLISDYEGCENFNSRGDVCIHPCIGVSTVVQLNDELKEILGRYDRILLLVLGGDGVGWPLPSGERLSVTSLISLLKVQSGSSTEILVIMEGLTGGKGGLPYKLENEGHFTLTGRYSTSLQSIVVLSCDCYTSIIRNENEGACECPFISSLLELLRGGVNSLQLLVSRMERERGVLMEVHSSYPISATLWTWLWYDGLEIYINHKLMALVVEESEN